VPYNYGEKQDCETYRYPMRNDDEFHGKSCGDEKPKETKNRRQTNMETAPGKKKGEPASSAITAKGSPLA